jgi:hypothetical protein
MSAQPTTSRCACCGGAGVLAAIVRGVPCERAIRVAPETEMTPAARAFVARLAARAKDAA